MIHRRDRGGIAFVSAFLLFSLFSFHGVWAADSSSVQLRVVYPPDKANIPAVARIFVYGSVNPPGARVFVNGTDSPLVQTASGGWLALVPLKTGKFPLVVRAVLPDGSDTTITRMLKVADGAGAAADAVKLSPTQADLGEQAVRKPPVEKEWKPHRIGRILSDTAYLRAGPDVGDEQAGYDIRLQKNVLVTVVGQVAKTLHVRLSDLESVWVDEAAVRLMPKQTPRPECLVNAWSARRGPRSTVLQTVMEELLPYRVIPSTDGMTLTLKIYGGISNTDWVHYAAEDPWVRHAHWSHPMRGVYQIDFLLRRPIWGYDVRYEGRKLIVELRDPPSLPAPRVLPASIPRRERDRMPVGPPLENVRIALDPGHPPLGTTSPHGVSEHVVNWLLALNLREVLTDLGADVVMTRQDGETLPLPDRVSRAASAGADLFVSVHTNALAPGENPFERNGYSVYYFQPFSQPFAESVHLSLRESLDLRDDGLHYGNLHVVRQAYMPSILVECGYFMWPPEEEMLLDSGFQQQISHAIASGIQTFLEKRR